MIRAFRLENFKCFKDETLALRPLSLITGANATGKSSLLQGILVAQQVLATSASYVSLNGPFHLDLGKTDDVLCQSGDLQREVSFEVRLEDEANYLFRFQAPEDALVLQIAKRPPLPAFDLTYLSAERIGPRELLNTESVPDDAIRVGTRGEFTAQVLARRYGDKVRGELRHPNTMQKGGVIQLIKQVELWMQDITPAIEIQTVPLLQTSVHALRFKRSGDATSWLRPPNIGFGVSYALPIIVAGLLAPPGSLFLVENPEAHLHPAGQSRIGRFLATLAAAGVQVIAETHSDHVLNGVRLAAVDSQHPIQHDQVIVQYFHGDDEAPQRAKAIELTAKGGLSSWPTGFFDQSEKDLAAILEARRHAR